MFRFTIRDLLWLMVLVGLGVAWFYHATGLWIGKAMCEDELRLCNDEIKRLRTELSRREA